MGRTIYLHTASAVSAQSLGVPAGMYCCSAGSQEINHQGDQQTPGQHAAGELNRSQAESDDVAHSEIGGAYAGSREYAGPAGGHNLGAAQGSKANLAVAQISDGKGKIPIGGKQPKFSEYVDHAANADIPEEIFRGFGASLSGFVNFRCGYRFRKGQLRIFHHHPAHQGNEEHSEDAAHHDQRGGFPIRIPRAKRRPCLGNQKCGNGEDRARRDAFPDRTRSSGDVLFQQRSLPGPHRCHGNDGCRIRGRDRDSGPQAEVGIGRAQNDRHGEPQQNGAPGKLAHLHTFRDVGLKFLFVRAGRHGDVCTHARILGSAIAAGGLIIKTLDVQILGDKQDGAR